MIYTFDKRGNQIVEPNYAAAMDYIIENSPSWEQLDKYFSDVVAAGKMSKSEAFWTCHHIRNSLQDDYIKNYYRGKVKA